MNNLEFEVEFIELIECTRHPAKDNFTLASVSNDDLDESGSYVIPNHIRTIGPYAFSGLDIKYVTIPSSVKIIRPGAFRDCKKLIQVDISDNVTVLHHAAFMDCVSLRKVKLSNNLNGVFIEVFSGCSNLESIVIHGSDTCPSIVESLSFANCKSLMSSTISEGVNQIRAGAFLGCKSLKEMILPPSVYSIDKGAFEDCESLTKIVLPVQLIKRIVEYCPDVFGEPVRIDSYQEVLSEEIYSFFEGCINLKELTIGTYNEDEFNEIKILFPENFKFKLTYLGAQLSDYDRPDSIQYTDEINNALGLNSFSFWGKSFSDHLTNDIFNCKSREDQEILTRTLGSDR